MFLLFSFFFVISLQGLPTPQGHRRRGEGRVSNGDGHSLLARGGGGGSSLQADLNRAPEPTEWGGIGCAVWHADWRWQSGDGGATTAGTLENIVWPLGAGGFSGSQPSAAVLGFGGGELVAYA